MFFSPLLLHGGGDSKLFLPMRLNILRFIDCWYFEIRDPKFEKCEFKTESDKHLGNIKSFENIQGNDKQAKIVYVHVSKLPNNIETINSLSDLGYLENILPTKKNNETYGLCFI